MGVTERRGTGAVVASYASKLDVHKDVREDGWAAGSDYDPLAERRLRYSLKREGVESIAGRSSTGY